MIVVIEQNARYKRKINIPVEIKDSLYYPISNKSYISTIFACVGRVKNKVAEAVEYFPGIYL